MRTTFKPFLLHLHKFQSDSRLLMFGVVLLGSFGPALYASAGTGGDIFLFAAASRLGWLSLAIFYFAYAYRRFLRNYQIWRKFKSAWKNRYFFLTIIQPMDVILTVLAVRFIDVSAVSVLTQSWPLLFMLIMLFAFQASKRDKWLTMSAGLIAFLGCALVILGQTGADVLYAGRGAWGVTAGIACSLLASAFLSLQAYRLLWVGKCLIADNKLAQKEVLDIQIFGAIIALTINFILFAVLGWWTQGFAGIAEFASSDLAAAATFWGLIGFFVCLFWTYANLLEHNPAVNLILYLAPVLSLVWLVLRQQADISNFWLVGVGTIMVTSAGLLSHFRHPHPRHHHRPLSKIDSA